MSRRMKKATPKKPTAQQVYAQEVFEAHKDLSTRDLEFRIEMNTKTTSALNTEMESLEGRLRAARAQASRLNTERQVLVEVINRRN